LIGFVVEALMETREPGAEFRDENAGLVFLYLKTVIDCLDQASH
jgi:hypothetical protein